MITLKSELISLDAQGVQQKREKKLLCSRTTCAHGDN